jgi:hypothetical protein
MHVGLRQVPADGRAFSYNALARVVSTRTTPSRETRKCLEVENVSMRR